MSVRILIGDCRERLREMEEASVQCCVTSPPYFGLRDYGVDGQIGLEETPEAFVAELVAVFREVRRVLRDDGTLWLNLGDSYNADGRKGRAHMGDGKNSAYSGWQNKTGFGTKPKDLLMIPARVALALQSDGAADPKGMRIIERVRSALLADYQSWDDVPVHVRREIDILDREWGAAHQGGWYLRSEIIWHKPNPMPESVTDRPTSAHEKVFLLSKSERYFYDAEAIKEPAVSDNEKKWTDGGSDKQRGHSRRHAGFNGRYAEKIAAEGVPDKRNARNVWTIATQPFAEAHFATMAPELAERCIKAGSRPGDMVLDPFGGAGTTGLMADRLGRHASLIELNPEYAAMAERRISGDAGMFASVEAVA